MSRRLKPVKGNKNSKQKSLAAKVEQAYELLSKNPEMALQQLKKIISSNQKVPVLWVLAGRAYQRLGQFSDAEKCINRALILQPDYPEALYALADLMFVAERYNELEIFLTDKIRVLSIDLSLPLRALLANVFQKNKRYAEAIDIYNYLIAYDADNWLYWNNLGMIYQDMTDFEKMEFAYEKSCQLTQSNTMPYFNQIVAAHYNPEKKPSDILLLCKRWQEVFKNDAIKTKFTTRNRSKDKCLRIGLISDGFRSHPVGNMITEGLSHIPLEDMEFYVYSTNHDSDHVTYRIKSIAKKWYVIDGISDEAVEKIIREDEIDILFDLCGYNVNSRMQVFLRKLAPIQIKWVGGLISSTGIEEIDYLLSDNIETPPGSDSLYTEKLIRLPGDYICYKFPPYLPDLALVPALTKGFITFGCFNNAVKVNSTLIRHWSDILKFVPGSRLYLKSFNFRNEEIKARIYSDFEFYDICHDRIIIEGDSPHDELLKSYNEVDIALDPWPYSGGLTTCEAMAMGVPVITLPGPTFAGRHSATHVANAGMPELIASDWDEYKKIAINLAEDVESLIIIRKYLREKLSSSPVCNAPYFAKHFSNAMRAVWQRHCDGKLPESLSLYDDSNPMFHGDEEQVLLHHPKKEHGKAIFSFSFSDKILLLDYGASISVDEKFASLMSSGGIHAIVVDPKGIADEVLMQSLANVQYVKYHMLNDGNKVNLNVCLGKNFSSDLIPLDSKVNNECHYKKIITQISIPSVKLDNIENLIVLDWLILDDTLSLDKVFECGKRIVGQCLCIAIKYSSIISYEGQVNHKNLYIHLKSLGYKLIGYEGSVFKDSCMVDNFDAVATNGYLIYIPDVDSLHGIDFNRIIKLSYILHSSYGLHFEVYSLLDSFSPEKAYAYKKSLDLESSKQYDTLIIPEVPHMSESEIELLTNLIERASHYFEFGCGGSSKLVARKNLTVHGVESDKRWVEQLNNELGMSSKVKYVDIGPTKEWGFPVDETYKHRFPLYSESILAQNKAFDLILVDGRFRVACILNTIKHILTYQRDTSQSLIFVHDFWNRLDYHVVLTFLDMVERIDTAGVFRVKKEIDMLELNGIIKKYTYNPL